MGGAGATPDGDPLSLRDRLLGATYRCVARYGIAKTTVEDVVRESGVSRATIYRQFPGGRDELLRETVMWELGRFFTELADVVRDAPDLAELLERGLVHGRRAMLGHEVLQTMLATEPERLLPLLTTQAGKTLPFIAAFLRPYLQREADAGRVRLGVDLDEAADYLARMVLSLIGNPGRWDLDEPDQRAEVVRAELLGGLRPRLA